MLMALGFAMVASFMLLIMTRRLSALAALILVPLVFGVVAGHGADLGEMAVQGIAQIAPTATLLLFAVLYFALMIDAGLFDPLVTRVLKTVGDDPVRIALGTAAVALIVALDGDGATTALITITAFLPIYRRLGMNPLVLGVILGSANTVMNLFPWGGPAGRAAAALRVDPADVFLPLLPTIAAGMLGTLVIAWRLGRGESRRLAAGVDLAVGAVGTPIAFARDPKVLRPGAFWVNLLLTLTVLASAITHALPLPIVFMGGFALAAVINYPDLADQRARLKAHAENALPIVVLILAAGLFTGVMTGTGMIDAMAKGVMAVVPDALGPWLGVVTAFLSIPLQFVLSNDAYYFGVAPVIAQAAAHHGVAPEVIARASLLGLPVHGLSPLVAALYLVSSLLGCDVAALQRFGLKWAALLSVVLIAAAAASGAIL
jgi:CitMHS family citrate-Mg2+:H+ or citrate-Ca2+:H+ symporter